MILTIERKKKFLITMIVIMVCATALNFGLYNIFSSYFKGSGDNSGTTVLTNMLTTVTIIGIVTIIMVILIPKEAVHETMAKIQQQQQQNDNGNGTLSVNGNSGNDNDIDEDGDGINDLEEQQLSDMIDYDFESDNGSGNNKK